MTKNYMRYESGEKAGVAPLSVKQSTTISKMTTGGILAHLYKRHEIIILQVTVAVVLTWAVVTKLG